MFSIAGNFADYSLTARKAKVLGKNADAATRFGAELEGLSKEMKTGLKRMDEARAGFGGELQAELEQFSSKQRLVSSCCDVPCLRAD